MQVKLKMRISLEITTLFNKKEDTQNGYLLFLLLNFESSLKLGFFDEMQGAENLSRSARTQKAQYRNTEL